MNDNPVQWYASWFDTPYYHILYQDRDHQEAKQFMDALTNFLKLPSGGRIMDLACGRGRHSVYLNSLGYDVVGTDLSEQSIAYARQFENDTLHFVVHNMSEPLGQKFDAIFNLFTSFGYFDKEKDHLNTLKAIKADLDGGGCGVIDFMNVDRVIKNLVTEDNKTVEGIDFHLKRHSYNGYIFKTISFEADGTDHYYTERVRALRLTDFKDYFSKAGIRLLHCFGDYRLGPFDSQTSERLILIFR